MLLTPASVVHHLVERDLLDPDCVANGAVRVEPAHGRNRVFRVYNDEDRHFFVKQPNRWQRDELASCEREAALLMLRSSALSNIAELVPRLIDWQPMRRVMVCELLEGCGDLSSFYHAVVSVDVAHALGAATAHIHRGTALSGSMRGGESGIVTVPLAERPWAFSVERQAGLAGHSGEHRHASVHLRLCQEPALCKALAAAGERWRTNALIHGDLKWSNWLARASGGQLDELFVVDWEMGGLGDTAWDVAGMFYALLYAHVSERGSSALPTAAPSLRSFVSGYLDETGCDSENVMPFLDRCVAYLGARCVQGAYELPVWDMSRVAVAESTLAVARTCLLESSNIAADMVARS